jgi:hypothetical protein
LISLPKNKNNIIILEHNLTEIGALAKRGIKQSNEHKLKRSIAQKGKHWWNDGEKSYFTKDCPINCVKGRLSSTW